MRIDIIPDDSLELEQFIQQLWRCLSDVPEKQRMALLASLDSDVAQLLSVYVPLEQLKAEVSAAVNLASDDLDELLDQFSVPDKETADRLELTVQQVINLRTAARRRVARCLRAWLSPAAELRAMAT